jgi:RIO kinase 1
VNDYFVRKSGGETRILGGRGVFEFVVNERLDGVVASEDGEDEDDLKEVIRRWLEKGVGLIESDNNQTSNSTTSQLGGEVVEGDKGGKQNNAGEDDKVFMSSYIPRSLAEVYDPERDMEKKTSELIYSGVTGLGGMGKKAEVVEETVKEEKVAERTVRFEGEVEDESEENTEGEDSEEDDGQGKPRGFRHESKEDKKVGLCIPTGIV